MRLIKIFLIGFFLFLGVSSATRAQSEEVDISSSQARNLSDPKWQQTLDEVASQTKELLTENEKLSSEYEFLQEKVSTLRADLEKTRTEIKQIQDKKQKAMPSSSGQYKDQTAEASAKMTDLQKQIDEMAAGNEDLEKELADIQEKNRLWRMKVSTLETQKRDAKLDANYKEASADADLDDQTQSLQAQLDKSLADEKELTQALKKVTAQSESLPQDTGDFKKKNRDLQQRLKVLKRDIAAAQIENQKLAKSAKKSKPKSKGAPESLIRQKKTLEAEVEKLTKQLDAVGKAVGQSKEALEKKRQLMDQIMHLDAENQELHAKIDALVAESPTR